jgi:site-specific recombinase
MNSQAVAAARDDELARVLSVFESPQADTVAALTQLFDWVRPRRREQASAAVARYDAVVGRLEADPVSAARVRHHMLHLLRSRRLVSYFAESGILPATGFFTELSRIATQRLLPDLPDEAEMRAVIRQIFHGRRDWVWLQALPPQLGQRFWRVVAGDVEAVAPLLHPVLDQMLEALLVVAYRVGGIGVEEDFGRLGEEFAGYAPRFRGLASSAQRFVDAFRARLQDPEAPFEDEDELLVMVDQCEDALERARRASMRLGTSLHLTFLMRRTAQSLRRVATLARLLGSRFRHQDAVEGREAALLGWADLVRDSLRAENQRNSVREHLSKGLALLALRVTDNAAKTGEHYIADTREQYFSMLRAAAGAGLIIGAMALLKIFTAKMELPLFGYATFYSLNYGLGFVLIYMLHLTIATKQPAMTAQTIAGYLGGVEQRATVLRRAELERVVDLIVAVARSQFAAIVGNVMVALPTAIALSLALGSLEGVPIIDVGKAAHLLDDLSPTGWALPHAAVAGVFLFLSGLISGYFDNKASYARIGERVARLRWLVRLLGGGRAARVGAYIEEHLGGLMGNFLFGCMLGTAGIIGIILGLPIDIRHIAFSSANLGYALVAFDFELPPQTILWAALGVALIGFVNLAVSFALALWVALKARSVVFTQKRELLGQLWARFKGAPLSFFVAPHRIEAESAQ